MITTVYAITAIFQAASVTVGRVPVTKQCSWLVPLVTLLEDRAKVRGPGHAISLGVLGARSQAAVPKRTCRTHEPRDSGVAGSLSGAASTTPHHSRELKQLLSDNNTQQRTYVYNVSLQNQNYKHTQVQARVPARTARPGLQLKQWTRSGGNRYPLLRIVCI